MSTDAPYHPARVCGHGAVRRSEHHATGHRTAGPSRRCHSDDDPGPHQHFTAALATFGLRFEDHSSAVEVGLATCDALDRNVTPSQIAELLTQSLPITPTEAELLILTAVDELCTDDLTGEK